MIKITHFVNPHKFFFKWQEDEGFDKQLDEMEMKIKGSVGRRMQSPDEPEEFEIGDVVAVLMLDMNRWIRGVIKAKDETDFFYVWAVDYGVPLVSTRMQICKLPLIYVKMNVKYQRIHLGGLVNCVPAKQEYDIEKDCNVLVEQNDWSTKSFEIAQSVIGRAVQLKFDKVEEVRMQNGLHLFGHLKIMKADGSWNDLSTCLSNALEAKATSDTWATHAHRLVTINQMEWLTMKGLQPLQAVIVACPTSVERVANDAKSPVKSNKCQSKPTNQNKPRTKENQQVAAGESNENSKNQHDSVAAGNRRNFHEQRTNNRSHSVASSVRGGVQSGLHFHDGAKPNNRFNNYRPRNENYSSQFPKGWHTNKLNNPKYREEIEFFESGFVPPNVAINSSALENAVDESNQTKPDEKSTDENVAKEGNPIQSDSTDVVPSKVEPVEIKAADVAKTSIGTTDAPQSKKDDIDIKQNVNNDNNNKDSGGENNTQVDVAACQNLTCSNDQKTEQSNSSTNASQ